MQPLEGRRLCGRVTQFQPAKRFGFLVCTDPAFNSAKEVFFHANDILSDLTRVDAGSRLSFELVPTATRSGPGWKATRLATEFEQIAPLPIVARHTQQQQQRTHGWASQQLPTKRRGRVAVFHEREGFGHVVLESDGQLSQSTHLLFRREQLWAGHGVDARLVWLNQDDLVEVTLEARSGQVQWVAAANGGPLPLRPTPPPPPPAHHHYQPYYQPQPQPQPSFAQVYPQQHHHHQAPVSQPQPGQLQYQQPQQQHQQQQHQQFQPQQYQQQHHYGYQAQPLQSHQLQQPQAQYYAYDVHHHHQQLQQQPQQQPPLPQPQPQQQPHYYPSVIPPGGALAALQELTDRLQASTSSASRQEFPPPPPLAPTLIPGTQMSHEALKQFLDRFSKNATAAAQ
jgi:cold shock CspA family protein